MTDAPILSISERALAKVLEIRDQEPDGSELALGIKIAGVEGTEFRYEMAMVRAEDIGPGAVTEHHGELTTFYPADSVDNLRGATLDLSRDLLNPGLVIENPNSLSPPILDPDAPRPDLSGPIPERVQQVLDQQINPAIASHGGIAELVAVEDSTAFLRLGGGCQGCGLASVTLSQGIETTLLEMVPEITRIVDVTDHSSGANPYYEAAKK
ncbi:MAG: NifU family protein [Acidimicrobiia bacterium]